MIIRVGRLFNQFPYLLYFNNGRRQESKCIRRSYFIYLYYIIYITCIYVFWCYHTKLYKSISWKNDTKFNSEKAQLHQKCAFSYVLWLFLWATICRPGLAFAVWKNTLMNVTILNQCRFCVKSAQKSFCENYTCVS